MDGGQKPAASSLPGSPPWLSVVIPTYGRAQTLDQHITSVHASLVRNFPCQPFEIILINDASPDQTRAVLATLAGRFSSVRVLNLASNQGQQAATRAGMSLAQGSLVVTLDDDGKDDPADISRLVCLLATGYDVVYGVPVQETDLAWHRRLGTIVKEALLGGMCHKPKGIRLTGFRAMNRDTVDRVVADTRRHIYISATILEKPVRIGQVQVAAPARNASGYTVASLLRLLLWIALWYGPLHRFRTGLAGWIQRQPVVQISKGRAQIRPETQRCTRIHPEVQS
ncbi:MAG: glycosyltransferase [Eubacteriales bacterium]|nr:glycosyltransferase [Eubacteriales bacterium]